jgi:hypothetical protein
MINSNNFCRWSENIETCYYSLPLYATDALSIFGNFVLDNTSVPFSTLKLGLYSDELASIYLEDIVNLNQIAISGNDYSFYTDEWTVPVLANDNYRFVLYTGVSTIYYYSNTFIKEESTNYTSKVKYKNGPDALGYLYSSVPAFYNQFRIDLWTGRPNYTENARGYETYEGDFIKTKSDITKLVEFETRFFDEGSHEAFSSMLAHSEIYIDDIQYKRAQSGSYQIAWHDFDDRIIATGGVNLLEVDYSKSIESC